MRLILYVVLVTTSFPDVALAFIVISVGAVLTTKLVSSNRPPFAYSAYLLTAKKVLSPLANVGVVLLALKYVLSPLVNGVEYTRKVVTLVVNKVPVADASS